MLSSFPKAEEIAQSIGEIIEDVASGWGVAVESMLVKDIIFSNDLQVWEVVSFTSLGNMKAGSYWREIDFIDAKPAI